MHGGSGNEHWEREVKRPERASVTVAAGITGLLLGAFAILRIAASGGSPGVAVAVVFGMLLVGVVPPLMASRIRSNRGTARGGYCSSASISVTDEVHLHLLDSSPDRRLLALTGGHVGGCLEITENGLSWRPGWFSRVVRSIGEIAIEREEISRIVVGKSIVTLGGFELRMTTTDGRGFSFNASSRPPPEVVGQWSGTE